MLHFGKGDGTVAAVQDSYGATVRLEYAVLGFGTADAKVVVAPFLEQTEVLLRGNACIDDDHYFLVWMGRHGISGNNAIHHARQCFGAGH